MIAILSPAKTLDFETPVQVESTQARLMDKSHALVQILKNKDEEDLKKLMSISDKLAHLNVERFQNFEDQQKRAAIFAFTGDVYQGFDVHSLGDEELDYAQKHLRILSGLYGLLRPLDAIAPYRLEMGTSLENASGQNLYDFWGDQLAELLQKDLETQGDNLVVNLASKEYFKAVDREALHAKIIDVDFKEWKNGQYKFITFFAKKARGTMARFMAEQKVTSPEQLRNFNYDGYQLDPEASSEQYLLFKRG
jgi:hypothetical protein